MQVAVVVLFIATLAKPQLLVQAAQVVVALEQRTLLELLALSIRAAVGEDQPLQFLLLQERAATAAPALSF
jgi:hypothetical protein